MIKLKDLNNLSNIVLVGGDINQCLAEVEIMLDILEKDYTKYESFIYG
jgi:ribosome-associated protein YbcJ (S4-like RNA binding protein)